MIVLSFLIWKNNSRTNHVLRGKKNIGITHSTTGASLAFSNISNKKKVLKKTWGKKIENARFVPL